MDQRKTQRLADAVIKIIRQRRKLGEHYHAPRIAAQVCREHEVDPSTDTISGIMRHLGQRPKRATNARRINTNSVLSDAGMRYLRKRDGIETYNNAHHKRRDDYPS